MHALVLGAGVIGVTTAYYLSQHGFRVTVIDRTNNVGDEATFGNGGQLSYSFADALARPRFIAAMPRMLLGRDPGIQVHLEPGLRPWGLRFLGQRTSSKARENTIAVLKTAMRSAELMDELRERVPFGFSHRTAGKLVLLSSRSELKTAQDNCRLKNRHECDTKILSRQEAIEVEPAVEKMSGDCLAAIYSRNDAVADSRAFTSGLRDWLEQSGKVSFRRASTVQELVLDGSEAKAVSVDDDTLDADAVIVCMGAWGHRLLRSVGVNPQIYPVRGYSLTLPPGDASPSVSVRALKHRVVFSRINGFMRIAGFADFTGFDTTADSRRCGSLLALARSFAPKAADYTVADANYWGRFRAMTPNGRPRVGATGIRGLFMNTGHGMLGWTLACASAYDTAHAVARSR
jgi:D-amino-acid dehydrogenase